jgi:hypothetical protein
MTCLALALVCLVVGATLAGLFMAIMAASRY